MTASGPTWQHVATVIGEIAGMPVASIHPTSRLIADIDLDSLDLLELALVFSDEVAPTRQRDGQELRDWSEVTAGQLLDACQAGGWQRRNRYRRPSTAAPPLARIEDRS